MRKMNPLALLHVLSADFFRATLVSLLCWQVSAGWGSDSDESIYGNSLSRDWLYNSNAISLQLQGCMWGYVDNNEDEDSGCMEQSSEDGTTYWYQMANCRRAQAVFALYAANSGNSASCSSSTFKESVSHMVVRVCARSLGMCELLASEEPQSDDCQ